MRTFVVGDIHGCFDELQALLAKINLQKEDMLISVGDIVDRGNKSVEVFHFLKARPNTIVLMGNHERKHQRSILNYSQEIVRLQFGEEYASFLVWIDTLPYYHETESAIIVHAGFEHDVALPAQRPDVLCGSTSGERYLEQKYPPPVYWSGHYAGEKPIIFGHHVVGNTPVWYSKALGIDTGCCHAGYLTAIELPSFEVHQVKAERDYWHTEQRVWQVPVLKSKNWDTMTFEEIDKQLEKLNYVEETEARGFLQNIADQKTALLNQIPSLHEAIGKMVARILETNEADFTEIAQQYPFKNYLFKSRANNLRLENLVKGWNSPAKITQARQMLAEFL